jgi:hypothetical protein
VSSFVNYVTEIANDIDTEIEVAHTWSINYRVNADVIICGSKYIDCIGKEDYGKVRLVLKKEETVMAFIRKGITHFIFDYTDKREVAFSMFIDKDDKLKEDKVSLSDIISEAHVSLFHNDRYYFNFTSGTFKYQDVGIYLRKSEKEYLAKWVLMGNKDNSKRILLCKMRKRFGKDFMKDVDRKGNYTGRNTDA